MPAKLTLKARPDLATEHVQAALDRALEGPLHLILGAGTHLCGGLRLHSGTTLELHPAAQLRFVPDYDAYAQTTVAVEAETSDRAMLTATGARDLVICGKGTIQCDGSTHFSKGDDPKMGTRIPASLRPRVLVLDGCENILLRDVTVLDSPMWTLHFIDCANVGLSNLRIDNDRRMPNTDGVVIDSCRDVTIRDCEIRTADDGIVLKTSARLDGAAPAPCTNINVLGCLVESRSCALKIGTESYAGFTNIRFEHCTIEQSNRALGIFSRDGGQVSDVVFSDITLDCQETPDGFWGSGEALTINALDRRPDVRAGAVSDVTVRRLRGRAPGATNLWGERPGLVRGVTLSDIRLTQTVGDLGSSDAFDLRPTPADLHPSAEAAGRVNAWRMGPDGRVIGLTEYPGGKPALFAHNLADLDLSDVEFHRPEPLPPGWSALAIKQSADEQ